MASNEDTNDVELKTILDTIDSLKKKVELIVERKGAEGRRTNPTFSPDAEFLSGSDTAFANAVQLLDQEEKLSAEIVKCIELSTAELQKAKGLAKQQGRYNLGIRQEFNTSQELRNAAYGNGSDNYYGRNSRKGAGSGTHDPSSASKETQIDSAGESTHTAESAQPETDPSGSKSDKNEERAHSGAEDAHKGSEGSQGDPSGKNRSVEQPTKPMFDSISGSRKQYGLGYDPYPLPARDNAQGTSKNTTVLPSPPDSPDRNRRLPSVEDEIEQTDRPKISKQFAGPILHRNMSNQMTASQGESAMRETPLKRKAEIWNNTEDSHTSSEGSQGDPSGKNSAMQQSATKKVVLERPGLNKNRNKEVPQPSAQEPSYNFTFTHKELPIDDEYVKNAESVQKRRSGRNRRLVPRYIDEMP